MGPHAVKQPAVSAFSTAESIVRAVQRSRNHINTFETYTCLLTTRKYDTQIQTAICVLYSLTGLRTTVNDTVAAGLVDDLLH